MKDICFMSAKANGKTGYYCGDNSEGCSLNQALAEVTERRPREIFGVASLETFILIRRVAPKQLFNL